MKFIISVLLTLLLSFTLGLYLGWWSIAIAAFAVAAIIPQKPGLAYLSGFAALFILWGGIAWWIDVKNQHILSHKIASLFPINGSSVILILVTAFIAAVVAGFGALSGSYLRSQKL
ncbi:MAG: hypothetical protein QM731_09130 [Chitinophagaceae bacterium]